MLRFAQAAGLALGSVMLATQPIMASEYQCKRNDSALRIAIEVKKAGHTLPCEVIVEDDRNERAVLYSAKYDRGYCPERLEKTRTELESEGWACQQSSTTNVVRGTGSISPLSDLAASDRQPPTTPNGAAIADSRSCKLDDGVRRIRIEVEDVQKGKPCALVYWSETNQDDEGQVLWRAEHDAEFCTKRLGFIVDKWTDEGWRCSSDDGIAEVAVETAIVPELTLAPTEEPTRTTAPIDVDEPSTAVDPKLEAIIEADAERIGEWMEVEADIKVAAHGDLNADGTDDAIVFLAYQSEQAAYRQYLMSYLVADETYELAGVKLLTGANPPPAEARVEQIDDGGTIWLSLPEADGTRLEPIGYQLRNQQLVEVETSLQAEPRSN